MEPIFFPQSDRSTRSYRDLLRIIQGNPSSEAELVFLVQQAIHDQYDEIKRWAEQVISDQDTNPVVEKALVVIRNAIVQREETARGALYNQHFREIKKKLRQNRPKPRESSEYEKDLHRFAKTILSNNKLTKDQKQEHIKYLLRYGIKKYIDMSRQIRSFAGAADKLPRPSPAIYMDDDNTQMLEKESLQEILKRVRLL